MNKNDVLGFLVELPDDAEIKAVDQDGNVIEIEDFGYEGSLGCHVFRVQVFDDDE